MRVQLQACPGWESVRRRHRCARPRRGRHQLPIAMPPPCSLKHEAGNRQRDSDATAQASASGQPVEGLAGFSGGSSPRAIFHAAFNPARTVRPAAAPVAPPTTFHVTWFSMGGDCPNALSAQPVSDPAHAWRRNPSPLARVPRPTAPWSSGRHDGPAKVGPTGRWRHLPLDDLISDVESLGASASGRRRAARLRVRPPRPQEPAMTPPARLRTVVLDCPDPWRWPSSTGR